jgi:hypothetical protein
VGRAGKSLDQLETGSGHRLARHRPTMAAPPLPRVLDPARAGPPEAAHPSAPRSPPSSGRWPRRIPCGAPRASMASS